MIKKYLKSIKKYGKKIRSKIDNEFAKEPTYEYNIYKIYKICIHKYKNKII